MRTTKGKTRVCERPDRHNPKLVCGYPLPCPHHTVIIEEGKTTIPHAVNTPLVRERIKQIKEALK